MRTYGEIVFDTNRWIIKTLEPHAAIRLKHVFPRIQKTSVAPYVIDDTPSMCTDICWYMERYQLKISDEDLSRLRVGRDMFHMERAEIGRILLGEYVRPALVGLKEGQQVRPYQGQAVDMAYLRKALLVADDLGLGKSYTAIAFGFLPGTLPLAIVVQTHLQEQWAEKIEEFSTLRAHKIKKTSPYDLPPADIYIFKYTQLAGWVNVFEQFFFKGCIYDEIQELRTGDASGKGCGAYCLSDHTEFHMGLSATPIYGYGTEIFNIMRALDSSVLGQRADFLREWCHTDYGSNAGKIVNPEALGAYLREQNVFIRRTKADVGQQMPKVNVINYTVESDSSAIDKITDLARVLARQALTGSFLQRGQATRELDILVRQATGVGKAKSVAAYARIMLENNIPIILVGWHRAVYDIWLEELKEFSPVMYTGSESPRQKEQSKEDFVTGKTNLFILSLRSGAGLDGLQHRCSTVIFGELDWSKKIHQQVIGRVDREGQTEQVMAIYCTSEDGSDPPMIDILALKESQSKGIVDLGKDDPFESDDSRLKILAQMFLNKHELMGIQNSKQPDILENKSEGVEVV